LCYYAVPVLVGDVALKPADFLLRRDVSVSETFFKKPMRLASLVILFHFIAVASALAQSELDAALQAVRKQPKNPVAHYNLGVAYANDDQHEKAVEAFQQAIRLNPKFAEAYYSLGMSYEALEYYVDAVRALKEALRLNPKLPDLQLNLGLLLSKAGQHQEAIKMLRAIRVDKDSLNYFCTIGTVALKSDSTIHDAIEAFEHALRLKPDSLLLYQLLGDAYRKAKRYADAVHAYEQILAKDPTNDSIIYALGVTYVLARQRAAAFKQHEKLEKLNSPFATTLINYIFEEMPTRQDSSQKR